MAAIGKDTLTPLDSFGKVPSDIYFNFLDCFKLFYFPLLWPLISWLPTCAEGSDKAWQKFQKSLHHLRDFFSGAVIQTMK